MVVYFLQTHKLRENPDGSCIYKALHCGARFKEKKLGVRVSNILKYLGYIFEIKIFYIICNLL